MTEKPATLRHVSEVNRRETIATHPTANRDHITAGRLAITPLYLLDWPKRS